MLPVTHYLDVQVHQVNHGQTIIEALPALGILSIFILAIIVAMLRARALAKPASDNNNGEGVEA